MENNDNIFLVIKGAIAAVAGMYSAAFGVVGCLALVWVACMAVDYISGTAAACKDGEWSSAVAREGIYHKGGMILPPGLHGVKLQRSDLHRSSYLFTRPLASPFIRFSTSFTVTWLKSKGIECFKHEAAVANSMTLCGSRPLSRP